MNKQQQNAFIKQEIADLSRKVNDVRYADEDPPATIAKLISQRDAMQVRIGAWERQVSVRASKKADRLKAELHDLRRSQAFAEPRITMAKIDEFRKRNGKTLP